MNNEAHIEAMRRLGLRDRKAYLQKLIGPKTDSKVVLHERALLITALNNAEVWPPRDRRAAA